MRSDESGLLGFENLVPGRRIDLGTVGRDDLDALKAVLERSSGNERHEAFGHEAASIENLSAGLIAFGRLVGAIGSDLAGVGAVSWSPARVESNVTMSAFADVTSRVLSTDGTSGEVVFSLLVVTAQTPTSAGQCCLLVRSHDARSAMESERERPSFASVGWVRSLEERLGSDPLFIDAVTGFDGSLAVRFGEAALGVRLYGGRIIDSGASVASGATVTVAAPYATWIELSSRPRNEFISFAMSNRFNVSGSTYEYLRLTRALVLTVDHVRSLLSDLAPGSAHA